MGFDCKCKKRLLSCNYRLLLALKTMNNKELINFTDLDPHLMGILDNFSSLFNIRIAYFLPNGKEYKVGSDKSLSNYCQLLRKNLEYESKCLALDSRKQKMARKTKKIQAYICHAGCHEAIKPIYNRNILLGYIMIGQTSSQSRIPDSIYHEAKRSNMLKEVTTAFTLIPQYNNEKTNQIISLFSDLVDLIILKNFIKQKNLEPVQKVIEYMNTEYHKISLKQASEIANMSESRLRHKFKEELGKTFSQIRNSINMNKALKILKDSDELSVKEVAFQLGYSDPLYFSKTFKKYFGYSPSKLWD